MDVTEKIIKFESYEALIDAIAKDISSKDFLAQRYGVRFIMLNNFETYQTLAKYLQEEGVELIGLESILSSDDPDVWITTDMLKQKISSCDKPSLITPFSELVRFYPEEQFRGFFSEIILSEACKGNRIYIPIIGLQNRFTDFLSHFGRLQESAPIWQYLSEPQSVEVYLVKKYKQLNIPTTTRRCNLSNLREWLRFWKDQAPQEKIICSSLPITVNSAHAKPDNIFKFTPVDNAGDYIEKFLDITLPFDYLNEDSKYWDSLLSDIVPDHINAFEFRCFVRSKFNKVHMGVFETLEEWGKFSLTSYDRWLLWHYLLACPELTNMPYLSLCIEECKDFESPYKLFITISERLFYCEGLELNTYKEERLELMSRLSKSFQNLVPQSNQSWIHNQILDIAKTSTENAIDLCTGTFEFEKPLILGAYAIHPENNFFLRKIASIYPDAIRYMEDSMPTKISENQLWAYKYICEYKKAKLSDQYTDGVRDIILDKNASSDAFFTWYYTFHNTKDRLIEINNKKALAPEKLYWFDGLGVEYLTLIVKLFESLDPSLRVVYSEITRSNIPSSTTLNGFYEDGVTKFDGIDKIGHDAGGYKQYSTLVREIDMIRDYVERIIADNQGKLTTFAIVSDHGMSSLSRKVESRKLQGKYEHEGRYIRSDEGKIGNDDFFFEHTNETDGKKYRIALRHTSLSTLPTHEVHGGATPEEVLVPFIIVSNKQSAMPISYSIKLKENKIALSDAEVVVTIMPQPEKAILKLGDKNYEMKRSGTKWSVKVDNAIEGKNQIMIIPDEQQPIITEIEFYGMGVGDINDEFDL